MTQSSSDVIWVERPFISVRPEGSIDQIVVSGKMMHEEYYPRFDICHIGFSDGTLMYYDYSREKKLFLVNKGSAFVEERYDDRMYAACYIIDESKIEWVICGELH